MSDLKRVTQARSLRAASTDAEHRPWSILRGRQLEGLKFRRQAPIGPYFADFACEGLRLIIEVDGAQHIERRASDDERTAMLENLGWRVIRFWNNDVITNIDGVADAIIAEIKIARARS